MPIVSIAVLEGSSETQRRDLIASVTEALVNSLAVPPTAVRVLIQDVSAENWGVGGVSIKNSQAG